MQLTNFLRDIAEDAARGRIYLPIEDLESFGVSEEEILAGMVTDRFIRLMKFEIERARALYRIADAGIPYLPSEARLAVTIARVLYARILNRIESIGYDVFQARARTTRSEKVVVALRVACGLGTPG
jgi:15-cis-phytoene synthase